MRWRTRQSWRRRQLQLTDTKGLLSARMPRYVHYDTLYYGAEYKLQVCVLGTVFEYYSAVAHERGKETESDSAELGDCPCGGV